MSNPSHQPQTLDQIVEHFKRELAHHAELERARITAEADAAIARIHAAEQGLAVAAPRRAPRRFERAIEDPAVKDVPAGALLIARRMADEGHPRDEVAEFLADNFRRIDVPAAVDHAFHDAPA